jgi:hypothetical protein
MTLAAFKLKVHSAPVFTTVFTKKTRPFWKEGIRVRELRNDECDLPCCVENLSIIARIFHIVFTLVTMWMMRFNCELVHTSKRTP